MVEKKIREIIKKPNNSRFTPEEQAVINNQFDIIAEARNIPKTDKGCPSCFFANLKFFRAYYG